MTGMKMGLSQLPAYLRRLRGIMTYDPSAKVDRFIRDSVLEEKPVDFTKLIEAKENIDKLNRTFQLIEEEVSELDGILNEYDTWEREKNRLLMDDIKQCYKKKCELEQQISRLAQDRQLAIRQKEEVSALLGTLEKRARDIDERLIQAQVNLNAMGLRKNDRGGTTPSGGAAARSAAPAKRYGRAGAFPAESKGNAFLAGERRDHIASFHLARAL